VGTNVEGKPDHANNNAQGMRRKPRKFSTHLVAKKLSKRQRFCGSCLRMVQLDDLNFAWDVMTFVVAFSFAFPWRPTFSAIHVDTAIKVINVDRRIKF